MSSLVALSQMPILRFVDNNGNALVGGLLTTQVAGVNYPTYSDAAGNFPLPNPIVLNNRGEVATNAGTSSPLYVSPNVAYTFTLQDLLGNTIYTVPGVICAATTNTVLGLITQALIAPLLNPTLTAEAGLVTASQWPYSDIRRYGALSGASAGSGGNGDCTAAIQNALTATNQAIIPPGDWRQDGQITLGTGQTVQLQSGAVVTRYSANSILTSPLYWFQSSYGAILGEGLSSQIITQNRAPTGIVLNGCSSMSSNSPLGLDMLYNVVMLVKLVGALPYGQTVGAPDACYAQINPQLDGKACYFAILEDVVANAANIGYWLQGNANANLMTNLHGYWIGNVTRATGKSADCLFFSQGALDYSLTGLFHHFSPNTASLRIEDYDNTATTAGTYHVTAYSHIGGFICEQGGTSAQGIIANAFCSAFSNKIDVSDNAAGGNDISSYAYSTNQINLSSLGISCPAITANKTLQIGNTAGGTLQGTLVSGSPTISNITPPTFFGTGTTTDLKVGAVLAGTGIPINTTVSSIGTNTITMSANATATVSVAEAITYTSAPGTLLVGTGKVMQFVTKLAASGSVQTIIPNGNLTVNTAVMVLVAISNADVNGGFSRTDLVLVNPRNNTFATSTVTLVSSAYTSGGGASEPNAVTYTLSFAAGAALPALLVQITPLSGSHTYNITCQLVTTG